MNRARAAKLLIPGLLLLILAAALARRMEKESAPHPGAFFVSWPESVRPLENESRSPRREAIRKPDVEGRKGRSPSSAEVALLREGGPGGHVGPKKLAGE